MAAGNVPGSCPSVEQPRSCGAFSSMGNELATAVAGLPTVEPPIEPHIVEQFQGGPKVCRDG